ncbi:amphi-Trp domain-containing protein [candidate division GN15 bacterium]|nr:amphi-Trp domain-containing protein [candidate division GN15 bacterium]
MSKKEVSFKGRLEQQQVMAYLNELVTGLKTGTVYVQNGDGYVSLSPGRLINIEIEAVEKKDKEKLVIEMTWGRDEEVAEVSPLKISTSEPVVEESETTDQAEEDEQPSEEVTEQERSHAE